MVAQALGINTSGMDDPVRRPCSWGLDAIEGALIDPKTGHPLRLRDVGVPEEERLLTGAFHAIADELALFNARPVNANPI